MYFYINSMDFIVDNSPGTNNNIITGLSDNIVYNSTLLSSSNNLQSNILNTSNYASNISNVIIQNSSNFTLGTSNILRDLINTNLLNTSNYASNISNVIIQNSSNFTLGTSNILRDLINTNLLNTSNYASNISNVIIQNSSNFTLGTSTNLRDLINTNLLNTSNYASNISNVIIQNSSNFTLGIAVNTSNYTTNASNILLNTIPINICSNLNLYSEKKYPPKLYNSNTNIEVISPYLSQNNIYKSTITLDTNNISYGSGTYDIYISSINTNQPNINYTGAGNSINVVSNDATFNYISFTTSDILNISSPLTNCDILVVGGGGGGSSGGVWGGNGGGAGAVVYIKNVTIPVGTYTVTIGKGGNGMNTYTGTSINNGGDSYFGNVKAAGGGGGSAANGGSGGGAGGLAVPGYSSLGGYSDGTIYGNNGSVVVSNVGAGGGGGAGSAGNSPTTVSSAGGAGGSGIQINITGTNTYYGGGGGGCNGNQLGSTGGAGGAGGGANGMSANGGPGNSGQANTGGGGGATFANNTGGNGGSGIVIIKFPNNINIIPLLLDANTYNNGIIPFKLNNYDTSGNYIAFPQNYILGSYYGDWIIVKFPNPISLSRIIIYINPLYINFAPSLWKFFGSFNGTLYTEIVEFSNNTTALTINNYLGNLYQIVVSNILPSYTYYGIVVKNITGNGTTLHISNLQFYARSININNDNSILTGATINASSTLQENGINLSLKYATNTSITNTSNYASNISNVIIQNSSNFTLGTSNILRDLINTNLLNTSNYASNISNVIIQNSSNFTLGIAVNTSNYTTNASNILKANIDANNINIINNYLPLVGGTMSGVLYVNSNIQTQQLYINNPASTSSIFFTTNYSIYSIFSRKVPWAMYFAEDYNASSPTVLPNYISNGRDATLSGTAVTKTTVSGNGALGAITYISGTTTSTILFPTGSIPTTFTILGLARYTGDTKQRILRGLTKNWLHGHYASLKGQAFYDGWKTNTNISSAGLLNDWLCCIGKNGGSIPGNILADGVGVGTAIGGVGDDRLSINTGPFHEPSDWALSCVMIWNTHLTDAEMVDLNTIVNTYKNDGISIKSLIALTNDDDSVIESRVYNGLEKTELLLFKGNDATGTNGSDRIRLKAGNIAFDTYSTLTSSDNRNTENIVMLINENGNVGIGTTTNLSYKLDVNGSLNSTSLFQNGTQINFSSYATNTNLTNYLPLAGGNLTGQLNISTSTIDNQITLRTTATDNYVSIKFTNNNVLNNGYIGIGATNLIGGGYYVNNLFLESTNAIVFNSGANTSASANSPVMILNSSGNLGIGTTNPTSKLYVNGNIDCGGGLAITGADAFYAVADVVDAVNKTNTYINFKQAGTTDDWCYLRQISTTPNTFKLALDFHDDNNDARFCIRSITSTDTPDTISEVFSVDMGKIAIGNHNNYQLFINPPTSTEPASLQTILQGTGNDQNLTLQASGGNVGIGTSTNITSKLLVNGNTRINGIVNITNTNPFATANNFMQSGSLTIGDQSLDYGGNFNSGGNWIGNNTAGLMLECLNTTEIAVHDAGNRVVSLMHYTGNTITIGRDMGWNAISSVTMNGNSITTGYIYAGGTTTGLRINGTDYGNTIYQDAITISGQPADIGLTLRNDNSFVFRSMTSPNYIELCKMNTNGFSIFTHLIYNYLFNSSGFNHNTINNFDSITHFGYRFIQGNVNAPNSLSAQWYQWYIGLGIDYPASGDNSHGCQFALPRSAANAALYVRFRESNSWGSWVGVAAEALTSGDKTINGTLTAPVINLTTSASGNNVLYIKSTNTSANNAIQFQNDSGKTVYMGLGGSAFPTGGNYVNTFFIEHSSGSIILNSQRGTDVPPNMIIHTSGNIGIGTNNPSADLDIYDTGNPKIYLTYGSTSRYFISGTSTSIDIGNDVGTSKIIRFMPDNVERMTILSTGNVGIGTATNITSKLLVYGTTQLQPKISLTGIEYFEGTNTNGYGIGLMLGVNRTNNRQLWICDTAKLIQNTSDSVIRLIIESGTGSIDAIATNGQTKLPLYIGGSSVNLTNNTTITGSLSATSITSATSNIANYIKCCDDNIPEECKIRKVNIIGLDAHMRIWRNSTTTSPVLEFISGLSTSALSYTWNWDMFVASSSEANYFTIRDRMNANALRLYINNSGFVGIGITSTSLLARLHVASGTSSTGTTQYRLWSFNTGAITVASTTAVTNVCAIFESSIWVRNGGSYIASSDIRIKTNIKDIEDDGALQKILLIEPKTYQYIDKVERGNNIVYGFIAQQIKEIIPEAVSIQKCVIPNIYSFYDCSSNIITMTSNIEKIKLNDTISIYEENIDKKDYTVTEIIPELNQIKLNENLISSNCFVYGSIVDDFHTLDKNYIFTLNVCATQELYKLIQQQQQQIIDLQNQINIIKSQLAN